MKQPKVSLTTEGGAPVIDNSNSQTAGADGPTLLQDHHLLEKLARFNRERIPERVVHAVGSGAFGVLEVTLDHADAMGALDVVALLKRDRDRAPLAAADRSSRPRSSMATTSEPAARRG